MPRMIFYIAILMFIKYTLGMEKGTYLGCYKYEGLQEAVSNISNVQDCVEICGKRSLKYAVFSNSTHSCYCNRFLGDSGNSSGSEKCDDYSVFSAEDLLPGPPKNLVIKTITDGEVQLSWEKPDGSVELIGYEITAAVLFTFSQYPIQNTTWVNSNSTHYITLSLQSGSRFNITVQARSANGLGKPVAKVVDTQIGEPDNKPYPPKILSRDRSQMQIQIYPVNNNNGPVSYYHVVVLDESTKGVYQLEFLDNYYNSLKNGLSYYIAAELRPEEIAKNFTIGDNMYYRSYHNVPLLSSLRYSILIGIVSSYNNITKVVYGNPSKLHHSSSEYHSFNRDDGGSIFLILGIVLLSILLIAGIVGYFMLRNRVMKKYRHNRLSEQELTLQGPMISIENSAYLPEDEQESTNHYKNLKKNVQIFNLRDELSVDAHSIVGKGRFGSICQATLSKNNESITLVAYSIADKSLDAEQKRKMLKSLDALIKCGKHENIIELVGTSESSHMLYVLLKVFPMNLKQFLINSRSILHNNFSKVSESQILDIIIQVSKGLLHLEKLKITHTKLCARNVMMTDELIPKIFGFGLADYVMEHELDYTRWTAVEVLKGQDFNPPSTAWSFGVLLWEICSLGGTPFCNITNIPELTEKVSRGIRLPQLKYFNDELYQIMLNCWQVDLDERPNFESICASIESLGDNLIIPFVSFQKYQSFQYEQYKPELEFKNFNF